MRITINVTQQDLDSKGDINDICRTCPIARAIRRHELLADATVGFSSCSLTPNSRIFFPKIVINFIRNFGSRFSDRTNVKPFSFILEVPDAPTE